ncbi:MAG: OmpA family protein [Pirellulales bacterium]|nr:OmpA family protein [Pirellulales bacterium]
MAGKGGGAWKVAYADFVTAMMAFFMVMWITQQNAPVKEAISQYFKDPYGIPSDRPSSSSLLPLRKDGGAPTATGRFKGDRKKGRGAGEMPPTERAVMSDEGQISRKPRLFVLHDGDKAAVGTVVFFADHSAELDAPARQRINELVPILLGKPFKIEVRGHAVELPATEGAKAVDPWRLSYDRCLATMKYLESKGIPAERIRMSQAGSSEPFTLRTESEAVAKNSRVEITMLGEHTNDLRGTRDEREKLNEPPPQVGLPTDQAAIH